MKMKKFLTACVCALTLFNAAERADAAMSYEKALTYSDRFPKEIYPIDFKTKDVYGEKNYHRYLSFLGKNGLLHTGRTESGIADRRLINFLIDYGFENIPQQPFAYIRWLADLTGSPDSGYAPKYLMLVFEDNFVKKFPLQGWEYRHEFVRGFLSSTWAHNYDGRIKLTPTDLYELSLHGSIIAASIDAGGDRIQHFFYTGNKDADKKLLFTKGIRHALAILEIDGDTIKAEYEAHQAEAEKNRLAALRTEIENEIKADAEREAMKQAILEEMKQKQAVSK